MASRIDYISDGIKTLVGTAIVLAVLGVIGWVVGKVILEIVIPHLEYFAKLAFVIVTFLSVAYIIGYLRNEGVSAIRNQAKKWRKA